MENEEARFYRDQLLREPAFEIFESHPLPLHLVFSFILSIFLSHKIWWGGSKFCENAAQEKKKRFYTIAPSSKVIQSVYSASLYKTCKFMYFYILNLSWSIFRQYFTEDIYFNRNQIKYKIHWLSWRQGYFGNDLSAKIIDFASFSNVMIKYKYKYIHNYYFQAYSCEQQFTFFLKYMHTLDTHAHPMYVCL